MKILGKTLAKLLIVTILFAPGVLFSELSFEFQFKGNALNDYQKNIIEDAGKLVSNWLVFEDEVVFQVKIQSENGVDKYIPAYANARNELILDNHGESLEVFPAALLNNSKDVFSEIWISIKSLFCETDTRDIREIGTITISNELWNFSKSVQLNAITHELGHLLGIHSQIKKEKQVSQTEPCSTNTFDKFQVRYWYAAFGNTPSLFDRHLMDLNNTSLVAENGELNQECDIFDLYFVDQRYPEAKVPIFVRQMDRDGSDFSHIRESSNLDSKESLPNENQSLGSIMACGSNTESTSFIPLEWSSKDTYILESLGYRVKNKHSRNRLDEIPSDFTPIFIKQLTPKEPVPIQGMAMAQNTGTAPTQIEQHEFLGYSNAHSYIIVRNGLDENFKQPLPKNENDVIEVSMKSKSWGIFSGTTINYKAFQEGKGPEKRIIIEIGVVEK